MNYSKPPRFDEPDEGYWAIILACIKPLMLILISVFAIMCFVTAFELNKMSAANLTPFSELTASSITAIPALITLIGFYATYHMHKSIMIIFFGLVILHGLFCSMFMIFALTNDCFKDSMTKSVLEANGTMQDYKLEIIKPNEPITDWHSYEVTWAIDRLQKGLSCCGIINDWHDWQFHMNKTYHEKKDIYPKSCCKKAFKDRELGWEYCESNVIFRESCREQLEAGVSTLYIELGALCLIQVLMIIGAQIIGFKVPDPSERPKSPAEIAWMQFVNAQYKTENRKTRSKSCV